MSLWKFDRAYLGSSLWKTVVQIPFKILRIDCDLTCDRIILCLEDHLIIFPQSPRYCYQAKPMLKTAFALAATWGLLSFHIKLIHIKHRLSFWVWHVKPAWKWLKPFFLQATRGGCKKTYSPIVSTGKQPSAKTSVTTLLRSSCPHFGSYCTKHEVYFVKLGYSRHQRWGTTRQWTCSFTCHWCHLIKMWLENQLVMPW